MTDEKVADPERDERKPVPRFKTYAEIYEFLGVPDPVEVEKKFEGAVRGGLLTRNQIREYRGLPPVEGGDEVYVPEAR